MEVLTELKPNKGLAIALGFFDGIHIGHKKILQTLVQKARAKGLKTAVITFDSNPADYFNLAPTLNIQTFKDREILMSALGIDYLYELDFASFKDMSAKEYLEKVIVKYFAPKIIVTGCALATCKDYFNNLDGVYRTIDNDKKDKISSYTSLPHNKNISDFIINRN